MVLREVIQSEKSLLSINVDENVCMSFYEDDRYAPITAHEMGTC